MGEERVKKTLAIATFMTFPISNKPIEPEPFVSKRTKRVLGKLIYTAIVLSGTYVFSGFVLGYAPAQECIEKGGTPCTCEQKLEEFYRAGSFWKKAYKPMRNAAYFMNYKK